MKPTRLSPAKRLREERRERGVAAGKAEHPDAKLVRATFYGVELIVECLLPDNTWRSYRLVEDALTEHLAADVEAMT